MQTLGHVIVPQAPPTTILRPQSVSRSWLADMHRGLPVENLVLARANYWEFLRDQIHLPPVVKVFISTFHLDAHFVCRLRTLNYFACAS